MTKVFKSISPISPNLNLSRAKGVVQYTLGGDYIANYPSISRASKVTGVNSSGIGNTCATHSSTIIRTTKRTYQAGGFQWRYMNESEVA